MSSEWEVYRKKETGEKYFVGFAPYFDSLSSPKSVVGVCYLENAPQGLYAIEMVLFNELFEKWQEDEPEVGG